MRLLIVEDDARIAAHLSASLKESGYVVDNASDGLIGRDMALEGIYDALIVDRRLPGLDGIELVQAVRSAGLPVAILMLSALASAQEKSEGLNAGCDDYLAKPYALIEVLVRLEAILSRYKGQSMGVEQDVLQVADLLFYRKARRVVRQDREIILQVREYLILEKLMLHAEQVVSRAMLLESAWDYDFDPKDNLIDKHIYRLRQKLDKGFAQPLIRTVAGAGYMISDQG